VTDEAVKLARDVIENGARDANGSDVGPVRKCLTLARAVLEMQEERERLRAIWNAACDWRRVNSVEHEEGTVERALVDAVNAEGVRRYGKAWGAR
jgi:hypothetical protein